VRLRTRGRCCSLRSFPNAPGLHPRCPSRKHPLYPNPQLAHSKSRPALPYGTVARPRSPLLRSSSTSPGFWSQLGSIPTISYTFETVNGPQAVGRGQEDLAAADWARAGVAPPQLGLRPVRLVFVDEICAATALRAARGGVPRPTGVRQCRAWTLADRDLLRGVMPPWPCRTLHARDATDGRAPVPRLSSRSRRRSCRRPRPG
jgi:hypothetical protein